MNRTKVGKVALTPKGAYDSGTTYEKLDIVTYDGKAYVVLADVKGVTPADGEDYKLLAKDGYTPQRGKDYWTDEDVASVVADVSEQSKAIVEEAAEAKKNSVLGSIPDDYSTLSKKVNNASNALKGSASGEAIGLNDVSPLEHTMGVMVKNKNLIPYPYVDTTKKVNGITFTDNGDGSITANGTATANAYIILQNIILQPGTYTLSGCPSGGSSDKYYLRVINTVDYKNYISTGEAKAFTITESGSYNVGINVNSGVVAENLIFKPQLEEGTTATAYTPYVDVGTVSVGRYGANLLNCPNFDKGTKADDGTISFQNAEGTAAIYAYTPFVTFPAGTYIASVDTLSLSEGGDYNLYIQHNATNDFTKPISNKTTYRVFRFTAPIKIRVVGEIKAGTDVKFKAQMNLGNTILPFEPYIEPTTHTPNADGTVQGVTSLYPSTTLLTDTEGAVVTCEYNRDINKAFEELTNAIISLGGNV